MARIGIYRWLNTVTGKSYVGSSIDIDKRRYDHEQSLKNGKSGSPILQNSYNKHGADSFVFEILEECREEELEERETAWIDCFNSIHDGYNITRDMAHPWRGSQGAERRQIEEFKKYPANWPEIRARILERDLHRCVKCGVKNFSIVKRLEDGTFTLVQEASSHEEGRFLADEATARTGEKHTHINLACAHLENPDPQDCRDENLAMMCFYHHSEHDRYLHSRKALSTGRKKRKVVKTKKKKPVRLVQRRVDMYRMVSVRATNEQSALLEAEAERQKVTVSDIVRQAIDTFFANVDRPRNVVPILQEKRQQNLDVLLQRLNDLEHEIVKAQAVSVRSLEAVGHMLGAPPQEEDLVALVAAAEGDVEVSLVARKKKTELRSEGKLREIYPGRRAL